MKFLQISLQHTDFLIFILSVFKTLYNILTILALRSDFQELAMLDKGSIT